MSILESQLQDGNLCSSIRSALQARRRFFDSCKQEDTTCFRVYHGATEGTEGLTADRYGDTLLFQTFRDPGFLNPRAVDVLSSVQQIVSEELGCSLRTVLSHRGKDSKGTARDTTYSLVQNQIDGKQSESAARPSGAVGTEQGISFDVKSRPGKDPWLYLDFRAGRRWLRENASGKRVLNSFSYSCTAGVAAAVGGASSVWNLDFSPGALAVGANNAELNGIDVVQAATGVQGWPNSGFSLVRADALPSLRQMAGLPAGGRFGRGGRRATKKPLYFVPRQFDIVVLDPPTFASSPFGAVDIVRDYQSLLKPAVLSTVEGGTVLATNHVSSVDPDAFLDMCSRCCAKAGRPLRGDPQVLKPDVDFPAMADGRHPLKMALLHV